MYVRRQTGFTIVELLIVIVVIGILATITIVAFNGIQTRARNAETQSAINGIAKKIEIYNAQQGSYPSTGGLGAVYTDVNCPIGTKQANWIPGIDNLPQSRQPSLGLNSIGCYMYASDGVNYILSAWNMAAGPQKDVLYRRVGFRETSLTQAYLCNHPNIGGNPGGVYNANQDYYKHSYTISNIINCNETPPAGA